MSSMQSCLNTQKSCEVSDYIQIEKHWNLTWNSQKLLSECFSKIIKHMNDFQTDHEYVIKISFQNCWKALDNKFSVCYDAYCNEIQQNNKLTDKLYYKNLLIHQLKKNIDHFHSKMLKLELELNIWWFVSFNSFNI